MLRPQKSLVWKNAPPPSQAALPRRCFPAVTALGKQGLAYGSLDQLSYRSLRPQQRRAILGLIVTRQAARRDAAIAQAKLPADAIHAAEVNLAQPTYRADQLSCIYGQVAPCRRSKPAAQMPVAPSRNFPNWAQPQLTGNRSCPATLEFYAKHSARCCRQSWKLNRVQGIHPIFPVRLNICGVGVVRAASSLHSPHAPLLYDLGHGAQPSRPLARARIIHAGAPWCC